LGGTFRVESDAHYPVELPNRNVTVDGVWIDRRAAANADFAGACAERASEWL
jgi:formylglycine-generating enzyme